MAETPNSYKDPYWSQLAMATEQKLGLPDGLLKSIVLNGEKSNNDQVSEAGARTPFQITPTTRKLAMDKWGVDAYMSPENAAEVSGLLLKDSLKRNGNDAKLAVSEYHGGTDPDNWGPRTRAYVQRVTSALEDMTAGIQPANGQSTFDRVSVQMNKPTESAIASVYQAYKAGQMAPDEAKQFESDVQAGRVMLPRGASMNSAQPVSTKQTNELPATVLDAYANVQMTPQEKAQLESDISSGFVTLPPGAKLGNTSAVAQIPLPDGANPAITKTQEPSFVDKAIGTGEAALNFVTGATGGMLGMAGGAAKGLVDSVRNGTFGKPEGVRQVEQAAADAADTLTYQPRTESGKQQAQAVGEAMQNVLPIAPMAGEMGMVGRAVEPVKAAASDVSRAAVSATRDAGTSAVERIRSAAPAIADRVERTLNRNPAPETPTPGTMGGVGSAGTDMATQRRALAQDLPVPIELTKGQAERTLEQQRFEQETAKDPSNGAALRERFAQQNENILKNFDSWVDQTGAEAPTLRAVGEAVDKAVVEKAKQDKAAIRVAYKNAEKAGELSGPVSLDNVVDYLNQSAPDASTAPILNSARQWAIKLGIAKDEGGNLIPVKGETPKFGSLMNEQAPNPVTLKTAETFRQAINRVTDYEPTNIRQATILKGLIDQETENAGGDMYRQARRLREQYARQYEDRAVIAKMLNTKKGMADRQVALEDIFNHSVMKGSLDDVRHVRRVLQTGGESGQQAWRELQGATVKYIRDEATKGVATDMRGNPIVSAAKLNNAIRALDHDGKLEFIFGKKGAQQLRDVNDLAKVVYTSPPGAVNTSNTASVLLAALAEAGTWGAATGLPVPALTGLRQVAIMVKNRRIQKRVEESLASAKRAEAKGKAAQKPTHKPSRTLH